VVVVLQSAVESQAAAASPEGCTELVSVPVAVVVPENVTLADAPAAKPAGIVQVIVPPAALQLAPAGTTDKPDRAVGTLMSSVAALVVAALPLLLIATVQVTGLPTVTAEVETVSLTLSAAAWGAPDGVVLLPPQAARPTDSMLLARRRANPRGFFIDFMVEFFNGPGSACGVPSRVGKHHCIRSGACRRCSECLARQGNC
jgi:hypothetical protein